MREILFRGKTKMNGEWVEGFYYVMRGKYAGDNRFLCEKPTITTGIVETYGAYGESSKEIQYAVIPETVGQYTGLTDKNGKKIFEGDIVEGLDFTAEDGGYGVVTFDDGAFEVVGSCYNNIVGTFHENYYGKDFEVIGNIHDNPEFLKGATDE